MKKDPNVVKRLKEIVGKGIVVGCIALMAQSASAAVLKPALLAKAAPDECFNGVGAEYLPLNPNSPTYEEDVQNCMDAGYQPKVNQAYAMYGGLPIQMRMCGLGLRPIRCVW